MATPEDFDRPRAPPSNLNRARTQAANALIEWFNGQEISQLEAEAIMHKVFAKLIVGRVRHDVFEFEKAVARHQTDLVHEMNERLHVIRRLPRG